MKQTTYINNQVEAAELSITNAVISLIQYLKETYDLQATIEPVDGNFKVYFNGYDLEEVFNEDKLCKDIKRVWNNYAYGYYAAEDVILDNNSYLIRTELYYVEDDLVQISDDIFLTEATVSRETIKDIEHSNDILDNRFIWLFTITDNDSNIIEENIETLAEALDVFIKRDGVILVAIPYIDPAEDNEEVDLVLADNPGPTILYDRELDTLDEGEDND